MSVGRPDSSELSLTHTIVYILPLLLPITATSTGCFVDDTEPSGCSGSASVLSKQRRDGKSQFVCGYGELFQSLFSLTSSSFSYAFTMFLELLENSHSRQ